MYIYIYIYVYMCVCMCPHKIVTQMFIRKSLSHVYHDENPTIYILTFNI